MREEQKNPAPDAHPEISRMKPMLSRHKVQVLLQAGHTQQEVARLTGMGICTVRKIGRERPVEEVNDQTERHARKIGRPSKAKSFRKFIEDTLEKEPDLMTLELLRRAREQGYRGGKTAFYEFVASVRPKAARYTMRFEGLPGEFTQHDFGHVDVTFLDGRVKRVHFFASRLKWSRWAEVSLVPNEQVETLVRGLAEHFTSLGGIPLLAVFDRPKTIALKWDRSGKVTEWNPVFASAVLELGIGVDVDVELCWPYRPQEKGSVERIVQWVKNSFFKQRRFHDEEDLQEQLKEWLHEINETRPSRASGVIPAERRAIELDRLRPVKIAPEDLALRYPIYVGPMGAVRFKGCSYSMPPEAACIAGTLYLYRDTVRIVAGSHEASHPRRPSTGTLSTLPEHRAARLAAISGKRGKRYLKRQDLLETGEAALVFLTELVHRRRDWSASVDRLHELLQRHGADVMNLAFREAVQENIFSCDAVERYIVVHRTCQQTPLEAYA